MPEPILQISGPRRNSLLNRVIAPLGIATSAIVAFMFSTILFAIAIVAAVFFIIYFWWKTRKVRAQLKIFQAQQTQFNNLYHQNNSTTTHQDKGNIIEGEVLRSEIQQNDQDKNKS